MRGCRCEAQIQTSTHAPRPAPDGVSLLRARAKPLAACGLLAKVRSFARVASRPGLCQLIRAACKQCVQRPPADLHLLAASSRLSRRRLRGVDRSCRRARSTTRQARGERVSAHQRERVKERAVNGRAAAVHAPASAEEAASAARRAFTRCTHTHDARVRPARMHARHSRRPAPRAERRRPRQHSRKLPGLHAWRLSHASPTPAVRTRATASAQLPAQVEGGRRAHARWWKAQRSRRDAPAAEVSSTNPPLAPRAPPASRRRQHTAANSDYHHHFRRRLHAHPLPCILFCRRPTRVVQMQDARVAELEAVQEARHVAGSAAAPCLGAELSALHKQIWVVHAPRPHSKLQRCCTRAPTCSQRPAPATRTEYCS
jgi:hypothetical protein